MFFRLAKFFTILLSSISLFAHEFNPAHLVVDEISKNEYEASWMYPSKNIGARAEVFFPLACERADQLPFQKGKYLVEKILLTCEESLKGQSIEVKNLSVLTDALVTITHLNKEVFEGLMNLKKSSLEIPLKEQVYPLSYFTLGIDHLMSGKDHILFFPSYKFQQWYGFGIGAAFSGVLGVGFYPILGSRVWCRFGCPMAALLGMQQRLLSRFRITTNGGQCISCGNCSTYCEMGIDVRAYAQRGENIVRSSCVGCGVCSAVCPRGVLKLENDTMENRITDVPYPLGNKL